MTIEQYIEIIRPRLSDSRFNHSLNVAKEAVRLAKKYGADPHKAEVAGVLHDVMKDTEPEAQLQILERFGIILTELERSAPKLWHAMSGAAFIEHELKLGDPEIIGAVRYHTTGRQNMTLLEKVLFIADFTSEERTYDGVEHMREAADKSLEKAMIEGIVFTVKDLADNENPIHPDTIAAYNEIVIKKKKEK